MEVIQEWQIQLSHLAADELADARHPLSFHACVLELARAAAVH